ncbi:MAG: aldo/keto reductase, partial [Myxococcota bacterium]|nr:aldo/keto reductase [Myxococcota bacterium]
MTNKQNQNQLIHESSPYLQQHASNPVHWFPWSHQALQIATQENKPIFLSIGYSACHWCHVMEEESFRDPEIANYLNQHFISIKVDREERPDIDALYMEATTLMNHGQGGWPMTLFLTPAQNPFFAGTYFPKEDKYGKPGFLRLLKSIGSAWSKDPHSVLQNAQRLTTQIQSQQLGTQTRLNQLDFSPVIQRIQKQFDPQYGGFGDSPKFPPTTTLQLLLELHQSHPESNLINMVEHTLISMIQGGIYDQLQGGFCRYSTDRFWLKPHFEKMLYDNGQLLKLIAQTYLIKPHPSFKKAIEETVSFLNNAMLSDDPAFYSALDADSSGAEGLFYTWNTKEIDTILSPEESLLIHEHFGITSKGNFEGSNILSICLDIESLAAKRQQDTTEIQKTIDRAKQKLLTHRSTHRTTPSTDIKRVTSWNALTIAGLSWCFKAFPDRQDYLDLAIKVAHSLWEKMWADDTLGRIFDGHNTKVAGCLEDYAYFGEALLDLYEVSGQKELLERSQTLTESILNRFWKPKLGVFQSTTTKEHDLILNPVDSKDGATPSAHATAAFLVYRHGEISRDEKYRNIAVKAMETFIDKAQQQPRSHSSLLKLAHALSYETVHVEVQGSYQNARELGLLQVAWAFPTQNTLVKYNPDTLPNQTQSRIVLCYQDTCSPPIGNKTQLERQITERINQTPRKDFHSRTSGKATPKATLAWLNSKGMQRNTRLLGNTGLSISNLGIGGIKLDDSLPSSLEHLRHTTQELGINIIDTATQFGNGKSEKSIGRFLEEHKEEGWLTRECLVLISKIGVSSGTPPQKLLEKKTAVPINQHQWFSMEPSILQEQLERTQSNLGVTTLDFCLLSHPEHMLTYLTHQGKLTRPERIAHFYQCFEKAIHFFETQVQLGNIQYYGIAANKFSVNHEHPSAVPLHEILNGLENIAGKDHHFRMIEFPLNILEPQNFCWPPPEFINLAHKHGIATVSHRSLNSIVDGQLINLNTTPPDESTLPSFSRALPLLTHREEVLRQTLNFSVPMGGEPFDLENLFHWSEELYTLTTQKMTLEDWKRYEHGRLRPRLNHMARFLNQALTAQTLS